MNLASVNTWWEKFWFASGSPVPIALYRICAGFLVVMFAAWLAPNVQVYFGSHAIVSQTTVDRLEPASSLSLITLLHLDDSGVSLLLAVLFVSGLFLFIGLWSKTSALISYLIILTFLNRNPYVLHTGIKIFCVMLLLLSISRCGEALSLSRLLSVWKKPHGDFAPVAPGSILGQRLIQIYLSLMYWSAFSNKLHGQSWLDGSAVYLAAHLAPFQRFAVLPVFDQIWLCQLLTWGTLLVEFSLCTLVWIREFRYPVLLAGLIFHLSLDFIMVIPLFQYIMVSSYLCFVEAHDLSKLKAAIIHIARQLGLKPLEARYRPDCALSCRLVETARRLDIFQQLQLRKLDLLWQPPDSTSALIYVQQADSWCSGLEAMREICARLPLLFGFYPLLFAPFSKLIFTKAACALQTAYAPEPSAG